MRNCGDQFIFNNKFEIVEESSEFNSVLYYYRKR